MSIEDAIIERIRASPPAEKPEVLQRVVGLGTAERVPSRSPKGILADLNFTLTEQDLTAARREMWGEFPL